LNQKRRSFIKQGSSVLATGLLLPKEIPFSILKNAPNETVRIGVIGTGDRGQGLMKILMSIKNIDLVALCDTLDFRLNAAAVIAPKAKKI
jgi:hypothetical protein